MNMQFRSIFLVALMAVTFAFAGCAKKGGPPPQPAPQYHAHTVTYSGETLAIIAKWYTGDSENWKAIANANPKVNPARMKIGTVLQIPMTLVKRTEPLPQKNIPRAGSVTRTAKGKPSSSQGVDGSSTGTAIEKTEEGPAVVGATSDETMTEAANALNNEATTPEVVAPAADQAAPAAAAIDAPTVEAPTDTRVRTRDELLDELLQ
ncbi:MAG: LysM domain-containing protein [Bdellovibrionota bacterium]|nr:MAG: LysM domain-containing protein [Bdellovibrionota bacterium]